MYKKILLKILVCFILVFLIAFALYGPVIFQEGNPLPQINGIIKLNSGHKSIYKLKVEGNKYISKSRNGRESLIEFMKERDYQFVEQMGAGYFFESASGERIIVTHRPYTRYYGIWKFTQEKREY